MKNNIMLLKVVEELKENVRELRFVWTLASFTIPGLMISNEVTSGKLSTTLFILSVLLMVAWILVMTRIRIKVQLHKAGRVTKIFAILLAVSMILLAVIRFDVITAQTAQFLFPKIAGFILIESIYMYLAVRNVFRSYEG